jgi:hypothetical protein
VFGYPLDHAVLAGCIAPFNNHQNSVVALNKMPLQFHQLDLQEQQLFFVTQKHGGFL